MTVIFYSIAYIIDLIIGDPSSWPHPVRIIGSAINGLVKGFRKICRTERQLKIAGLFLWIIIVGGTYFITWGIMRLASFNGFLYGVVTVYLAYTTIAARCLGDEARKVWNALLHSPIEKARRQLSMIVGRDTTELSRDQIAKATVETVAENTSDGVIAPLFFLFIGGPPLAMAYKAVNTLDSMVGYQNEKYRSIGYFPAKIDDIANYIPARLSWIFISLASMFLQLSWQDAFRIGWRDRKQHKSPNCAFPEGAVAGALGLQFGGTHQYFGEPVEKPYIGDETRGITTSDILLTNKLLYVSSFLAIFCFAAVRLVVEAFL
ncbi:MAG: adenosylcobinamide-phosphate synthase CbiB [Bacillus sp. (in: firmicutes)]